jgi:hypothetical protein
MLFVLYKLDHTATDTYTIAIGKQIGIGDSGLVDCDTIAASQISDVETAVIMKYLRMLARDCDICQLYVCFTISS